MNDFEDRWLHDKLASELDPISGAPARPAAARYAAAGNSSGWRRSLRLVPAAVGMKAISGVAVAALAAGTAGVTVSVVTGTGPQTWGRYVSNAVSCNQDLAAHGLQGCSATAGQPPAVPRQSPEVKTSGTEPAAEEAADARAAAKGKRTRRHGDAHGDAMSAEASPSPEPSDSKGSDDTATANDGDTATETNNSGGEREREREGQKSQSGDHPRH